MDIIVLLVYLFCQPCLVSSFFLCIVDKDNIKDKYERQYQCSSFVSLFLVSSLEQRAFTL